MFSKSIILGSLYVICPMQREIQDGGHAWHFIPSNLLTSCRYEKQA